MARKPRRTASTTNEFRQGITYLIRDSWFTMLSRFASVLEANKVEEIENLVNEHLTKNNAAALPPAYGQPFLGYERFAQQVSVFINRGMSMINNPGFEHHLTMRKSRSPDVYSFRLGGENHRLLLGPTSIPGAETAFNTKDPFKPVIQLIRDYSKIDLNNPAKMNDIFYGDDAEEIEYQRLAEFGGSAGAFNRPPNDRAKSLLGTDVVQVRVDTHTSVTDDSITIIPYLDIDIDKSLYDNLVEYEGNKQEPMYIYMWMMQAVHASSSATNTRRWKGAKVVDLRRVTKNLRNVKDNYGKAEPRVNSAGFCIGGNGLPLFVPEVDNCSEYVETISRSTKLLEDGTYDFAESHLQWSNKIVLVDWFNDYILYADSLGYLRHFRLLGVRKLDPATEMMFLNTPINQTDGMMNMLKSVMTLCADNVTPEEASRLLDENTKKTYDEATLPSVYGAFNSLELGQVDRANERSSFSNKSTIGLKHLLGLDLEELNNSNAIDQYKANAGVVIAYLRALYKKRAKLDIPVFSRLSGLEYIMWAAENYSTPQKWEKRTQEHSEQVRAMNSNHTFDGPIDIPNLEVGAKSIQALMPHQVDYLAAMHSGVQSGAGWIATGGGKGLLSPLDIIIQMSLGKVKRPLIVTKPRLVKENITEINRISKGKINVVPLRPRVIRHLRRKAGLDTFRAFIDWARNLPLNTIFVCAYTDFATGSKMFEDLQVPERALWYDVQLSQMVHILRLIGIDMVFGDEAHLVKNMDSKRSICAYSVFAGADITRIASGTGVANTPKDYVGEYYALNPIIFGNNVDTFEKIYNLRGGMLKTDEDARRMNFRTRELSRTFDADEEDWAFVLPIFRDEIEYFELTPLQEEFYDILLKRAMIEMQAKMEEKKPKKSGDDDDDDDDDEEEDEDARIIAMATASLSGVEQFVIAPDANEEYVRWAKNPTGDDLISPAVKRLDAYLDNHFRAIAEDRKAQEKVIVFSWNKVASVHLFKHSRWAKAGIRYAAGDEEAVRRFKTEDNLLVLFADEGSLREGENLQMSSLVCRMQPVWTPGDYKQAAARAYRPDPRGTYAERENVKHVWFIAQGQQGRPTISGVKLATLISKAVSNARLKYEHDHSWNRISPEFEQLTRLRMNFDLIFNTMPDDINPYLSKWKQFNGWIGDRVEKSKINYAERLEREHNIDLIKNGKILDMHKFLQLAMRPVTSKKTLPGSKRVYTPWELNATPADIYDLDLEVLGGQEAPPGTKVMTEFGAGIVISDNSDRTIRVEIYGKKKIGLRRHSVAIPASEKGKRKLSAILKDKSKWRATYISPKIRPGQSPKNLQDALDEDARPPKKPTSKTPAPNQVDEEEDIEIFTQIINGWPFLAVSADQAPTGLRRATGWSEVPEFTAYTFQSWTQADKFLDVLADKFYIQQTKFDKLVDELETLRAGRAMRLTQRMKDSEVRSFLLAQHRTKGKARDGRYIIDPYWVAFEEVVYLAFDNTSHNSSVMSWLRRAKSKVTGMKEAAPNSGYYVYPFKTMSEAEQGIRYAAKLMNFDADELREELDELKRDLKNFSRKQATPRKTRR